MLLVYCLLLYSGTGKTNTLVALIQCLILRGETIHTTAPTNVAIGELARRCISTSFPQISSYLIEDAHKYTERPSLSNFLLIGDSARLQLSDDDLLHWILLDSRMDLLQKASGKLLTDTQEYLRLFRFRLSHVNGEEVPCKLILDVLERILTNVGVFFAVAPKKTISCGKHSILNVLNTLRQALQVWKESTLKSWWTLELADIPEPFKELAIKVEKMVNSIKLSTPSL